MLTLLAPPLTVNRAWVGKRVKCCRRTTTLPSLSPFLPSRPIRLAQRGGGRVGGREGRRGAGKTRSGVWWGGGEKAKLKTQQRGQQRGTTHFMHPGRVVAAGGEREGLHSFLSRDGRGCAYRAERPPLPPPSLLGGDEMRRLRVVKRRPLLDCGGAGVGRGWRGTLTLPAGTKTDLLTA